MIPEFFRFLCCRISLSSLNPIQCIFSPLMLYYIFGKMELVSIFARIVRNTQDRYKNRS